MFALHNNINDHMILSVLLLFFQSQETQDKMSHETRTRNVTVCTVTNAHEGPSCLEADHQ